MLRALGLVLLFVIGACSDPAPRRVDGGVFVLPDAGFRDSSVRDLGVDAGPFQCPFGCPVGQACGCLDTPSGRQCGCHPRGEFGVVCDPFAPETCQDDLRCIAGRNGIARYFCSDGRVGSFCSKRNEPDVCTTALGCVCLTSPMGTTTCRCLDTVDPAGDLCDRGVPATCPDGTCVRTNGPGGTVFFVCSDGSEGQPCERGDSSCRTSLGCTCPLFEGLAVCRCSEPVGAGGACDPDVQQACQDGLQCLPRPGVQGVSTICGTLFPDAGTGGGIACDPADPLSCPEGLICRLSPSGGFTCQPN